MYGGGDRDRVLADFLIHLHAVPHLHQRLAGSAYVLYHGYHDLGGRRYDGHGNFRSLHIIGVYAAFKSMGHKLHLFKICPSLTSRDCITSGHKLSIFFGIKIVFFTGQVCNNPVNILSMTRCFTLISNYRLFVHLYATFYLGIISTWSITLSPCPGAPASFCAGF